MDDSATIESKQLRRTKMMTLRFVGLGEFGWRDWLYLIFWGYDIFIQEKVPFFKSLIALNVLVWLVLFR